MGRALVHNDADFPKGAGGEFGLYPNTPYRPVLGLVELFGRASTVRNVISGSGNRSDSRPDRGRLLCVAMGPLSRSATIKGGQARARELTFAVPTMPPQTLAT
jgi:hypothetical protein